MEDCRTVIEEIASQLGIAVDQAGQFISDYLPQYAAMRAAHSLTYLSLWALALTISIAIFIVVFKHVRHMGIDDIEKNVNNMVVTLFLVCIGIVIIFLIAVGFMSVPGWISNFIEWSNFPEAKLINMVLNRI